MTHAIIFSKDRAAQLDLFFHTFYKHADNFKGHITVIYTHSDDDFRKGYETLQQDVPGHYVKERDFKADLVDVIGRYDDEHIVFFVDDDIFLRRFDFDQACDCLKNQDVACFSLRLGERITKNYELGEIGRPKIIMNSDGILTWAWAGAAVDWGYPMSVDGHIFRAYDIIPKIKLLPYNHACNLESNLIKSPVNRPFMAAFIEPALVGCPLNRVQDIHVHNKYGNITAKELNDNYLKANVIDDMRLNFVDLTAVHSEVKEVIWRAR